MAKTAKHNPDIHKVTRKAWSRTEEAILWGKCAGRCELCNRSLYKNNFTQDQVKHGQLAHIVAFADNGPRADKSMSQSQRDSIDNILLLCNECHTTIDRDPAQYTAEKLARLKEDFEAKIRIQTNPTEIDRRSIIIFSAPISGNAIKISIKEAQEALKATGQYPKDNPISLELQPLPFKEDSREFWELGKRYVDKWFAESLSYILGEETNFALFALAPQPLLVYLGWKLGETINKQVFQRHRDQPCAWSWPKKPAATGNLSVSEPSADKLNNVNDATSLAVSFSISFDIRDRVTEELPADSLHWDVKPEKGCTTEYVQSPEKLSEFRALVHQLLDRISKVGSRQPIHIFLSMPVSMALTLGMSIMRKATNDIILHDYVISQDLDVEAITIKVCQ